MVDHGRLDLVDPRLAAVIRVAAARYEAMHPRMDLRVTSGLRTEQEQALLVARGASRTMRSAHLLGHAVDLAILESGVTDWSFHRFRYLNGVVQHSARELGVPIGWGGDWTSLRDGCHWYLAEPGREHGQPAAYLQLEPSVEFQLLTAATTRAKDAGARIPLTEVDFMVERKCQH